MRALTSLAVLAVAALASKDTAPMNKSKAVETTLLDLGYTTDNVKWEMISETINMLDEGFEYLRLTHILTAPIRATDQIEFAVHFHTKTDPWVNKETIAEDIAVCKLT